MVQQLGERENLLEFGRGFYTIYVIMCAAPLLWVQRLKHLINLLHHYVQTSHALCVTLDNPWVVRQLCQECFCVFGLLTLLINITTLLINITTLFINITTPRLNYNTTELV